MKKQTLLVVVILMTTLSSCVYSLFPIYTEDTLVFKEELLGKWLIDDEGSYMIFETLGEEDEPMVSNKESELKYNIEIKEGFTMSSDDPIFIMDKGRKIYDEDSIIMIMNERMSKNRSAKEESATYEIDLSNKTEGVVKEEKEKPKLEEYQGSVMVYEEKSYQLTVINKKEGLEEEYAAHLVDIGGDLFMDLYPVKEFNSNSLSDNFFPVHTFYKVIITEEKFTMIHFDLDKLNKLFESNLIRLRHENVEGTVLITAQPKELQKFIDKYSEDESVFDQTEIYSRAI